MIRALKMDMSREQIDQLVKDADPDGSGEIDFEEFTHVLDKDYPTSKGKRKRVILIFSDLIIICKK